ncbi:hypothetical protein [Desulfitobacterium sp.]|uniref:hypothetical protein n=1 Tax=Desulfitobacterium sp. TaxID=49981 RepID=UPI002B1FD588|nr:hypothetical protein [Desulfitobacterium sp.]MEA4902243.1 hypothetical protein [Desulfitobacterium sp.]
MTDLTIFNEARKELLAFLIESPEFTRDLIVLFAKYMDQDFLNEGYSKIMSSLMRTLTNPESKRIFLRRDQYVGILLDTYALQLDHETSYETFVDIIKKYVGHPYEKIAYCQLIRLMFGEEPQSVKSDSLGFLKYVNSRNNLL